MRRSILCVAAVGAAAVAVAVLAVGSPASSGINGCVRDRIDLADLGKLSSLVAVDGSAPDDVWAVGARGVFSDAERPVAVHYDGHDWREVPVAALKRGGLLDVEAISADNVWATASTEASGFGKPLVLHWNGKRWQRVPLPKRVYHVGNLAAAGKDVWVVGAAEPADPRRRPFPLTLRRSGRRWQTSALGGWPDDIAFSSPRDGWVVGSHPKPGDVDDVTVSYVARWNGRSWKRVRVPSGVIGHTGRRQGEGFWAVTTTRAGNVWAVGSAASSGFVGDYTLNWNGKRWRLDRDPGGPEFRAASMNDWSGEISIAAGKEGEVWLVAGRDAATRNDAGTWSLLPDSNSDVFLHAVSPIGRGEAWAVGDRGAEASLGDAFTAVIEQLDCRS
jgi:hypothetical protein